MPETLASDCSWDIRKAAEWVRSNGYSRVALQFPDEHLGESTEIAAQISLEVGPQVEVFVLADSAFNPEAVDEVAAQHGHASCVVHFGRASLSTVMELPVYYVFPTSRLDISQAAACIADALSQKAGGGQQPQFAVIFLDQPYLHAAEGLLDELRSSRTSTEWVMASCTHGAATPVDSNDSAARSSGINQVAGYTWSCPDDSTPVFIWVGPEHVSALQVLQLALNGQQWMRVTIQGEKSNMHLGMEASTQILLRRRTFLVEKAKNASLVGILVCTLATSGFRDVVAHIRRLAHSAGKKTYTMMMGKPNPAKLANFPEVDVFVMVADSLGFIMDSKPYFAPIVTPFEAALAFTNQSLVPGEAYKLGMDAALQVVQDGEPCVTAELQIQGSTQKQLVVKDAADFMMLRRTFKGLDAPAAGAEYKPPAEATTGRSGRAACYRDEPPNTTITEADSKA